MAGIELWKRKRKFRLALRGLLALVVLISCLGHLDAEEYSAQSPRTIKPRGFDSADGARTQRSHGRLHDRPGLQAAIRARRQSLDGRQQGVGRYGTAGVSGLVVGLQ